MKRSPLVLTAAVIVSMFTLASGPCGVDTEQAQAVVEKKQEIMRLKQEVIRPLGAEIEAFTIEQIEPVEDEIEELERGIGATYQAVEAVFRNELEPMFRQLDDYWSPGSPARDIQDSIEQGYRDLELEMREVDKERQELEQTQRDQPRGPGDQQLKWRAFQDEREAAQKAFRKAQQDSQNAKQLEKAQIEINVRALEDQRSIIWDQLEVLRNSGDDEIRQLEAQREEARENPALAELEQASQLLAEAQGRLDQVNTAIADLKVKLGEVDAELLDTPDKLEDGSPNEQYGIINGQRQAIMDDIGAQNGQLATVGAEVAQIQASVNVLNPGGVLVTPESIQQQINELRENKRLNEKALEQQAKDIDDQVQDGWKAMNEDPMARIQVEQQRQADEEAFQEEWNQRQNDFEAQMDAEQATQTSGPPPEYQAIEAKFEAINLKRQELEDYSYTERNRLEAEFEEMQKNIRDFEDTRMKEVEAEAQVIQDNLEAKYVLLDALYEERELLIDKMRVAEQEVSILSDEAETELLQFVQGVLDQATEMDKQFEGDKEVDFSADSLNQQFNPGPEG